LARLLASATIVRGPQLSILKRLPGDYHVKIHTNIIDYITEKMENYDKAGRKEQMTKAISLFKALSNILTGLDGRASLQV
jgi:cohesin complex subunit SA-1/2